MTPTTGRRAFVVGGLAGVVGMAFWPNDDVLAATGDRAAFEPTPWYVVKADGTVEIRIAKAEIGQHVGTAQAQAVAEELGVAWESVPLTYIPGYEPRFGVQLTGGSTSIFKTFEPLSRAGAAGRVALVAAASAHWSVPADECTASGGVVRHPLSGRSMDYGQIVQQAKPSGFFSEDALKALALKLPHECTLVGTSQPAHDIPSKVNGSAKYGIDHALDGQVFARPRLPPVRRGANVLSTDDSRARASVPGYLGFLVIDDPSGSLEGWIVAYATDWWSASKASDLLEVKYDLGPNRSFDESALQQRAKVLAETADEPEFVQIGDAAAALKDAPTRLDATYLTGTNLHGQLEPLAALAEQRSGQWHVYAGTQNVEQATKLLALALRIPESKITVHQFFLGGGFGRKLDNNFIVPAVLASQALGRPVKLVFSREDDLGYDNPRLPTYQVVRAGFGPNRTVSALSMDVVAGWPAAWVAPKEMLRDEQEDRRKVDPFAVAGAAHWYDIPNQAVRAIENDLGQTVCPPGYLRAVGPGYTMWALESFIDECAREVGQDPLAFRLAHLSGTGLNAGISPVTAGGGARLAAVLQKAAQRSGYGSVLPKDTAFGIGASAGQDRKMPTWIGCVARVAIDRSTGKISVQKMTVVVDVGRAINPVAVRAQVEGALLWGVSIALHEVCSFRQGRIVQRNYDAFQPLRLNQLPELDITLIESEHTPSGIGEPALTVAAPAIANAVQAACGVRLRSLPMTPSALLAGLRTQT